MITNNAGETVKTNAANYSSKTWWMIHYIPMSEKLKCEKVSMFESLKYSVISNPENISAKKARCFTALKYCVCKITVIVIITLLLYLTMTKLVSVQESALNALHSFSFKRPCGVLCNNCCLSHILLMRKWRRRKAAWQLRSYRVQVEFEPKLSWISRSCSLSSKRLFFR